MAGAKGIYGLSGSGLDVESLVKVGMISHQKKYDRIYKKEVETEWRKEAYANVYDKVNTFKSRMSDYRLSSSTKPMTTTSSNADAVTATANASAGVMGHTVEVTQAATNAYLMTATSQIGRAGTPGSTKLRDIAFSGGARPGGMLDGDTALKFKVSNGTGSAEVSFTAEEIFTKNLTLNDLANRINNARYTDSSGKKTALNIRASYDSVSDGFSLANSKTGTNNKIDLTVDTTSSSASYTTTLLNNMNLGVVSNGTIGTPMTLTTSSPTTVSMAAAGTNANVKIDGRNYANLQENNLTVNGVTYTFKKPTPVGTPATVNVAQDQDKLVENVKKFVDEYNALLDELNKLYGDKGHKDYGVLTKSQEEGMTKDQVEKWNAKAKEGLLYRDNYVRSIISDLRDAVINRVQSVPGRYSTLSSIGITAKNQTGHLQIDETKLKNAIAAEPDAVNRLISYDDENDDYGNNGVASRIFNKLGGRLKELERHSGVAADKTDLSELGKLIQNYEKQMSDFKKLMSSFESKLYQKYNAMETAISRLSTQFNFFNGQ
jgi:flagellar hook-associated protein 2 C-terminal domain protein